MSPSTVLRDLLADLGEAPVRQMVAGIVCGSIITIYSLSGATLLFSGDLIGFATSAMGITVAAAMVLTAAAALGSSYRPGVAQVQEVPVAYLAAMLAGIHGAAGAELATATVLIGVSSIVMGVLFVVVGRFGLSRFIRFVPFPVLSGFLSVVGFLVCRGAVTIILGSPATLEALPGFLEPGAASRLAAAALIAGLILVVGRRIRRPLVTPAIILLGIVVFNVVAVLFAIPRTTLGASQWIAAMPETARIWPPILPSDLASVDWGFVASSLPMVLVLASIAMMGMLMNVSGIEIYARRDIDLDHELRVSGTANIILGLAGGAPGYHSLSNTLLSMAIGGGTRLTTLFASLTLLAVLSIGAPLLALVPLPVLAGVLLAIGFRVLHSRLVESFHLMRPSEYAIVVVIFAISILFDFLTAVVLGTLFAMILFIIDYARQDVVRLAVSGSDFHSQAEASDARRRLLEEHGDSILILRLQGFLFFGSADRLKLDIENRLEEKPHLAFLILDFTRVVGIDSAAVQSFRRIADTVQARGCRLVLSHVDSRVMGILVRGGLDPEDHGVVLVDDFDAALAACEKSILAALGAAAPDHAARSLRDHLADLVGDDTEAQTLAGVFREVRFADGEPMIEQDAESREIYVIGSGRARVCIRTDEGHLTVATLGSGALVGEISFYLRRPRSASVISDGAVVAWRLDRDAVAALEETVPVLVGRFHAAIAAMLAERLAATNRLVRFFAE